MIFEGLAPADAAFREEVREFLQRELTPELVRGTDLHESLFPPPAIAMPWQAKLRARGWLAPHWPREHGGVGWSAMQRFIFETEAALAGAPALSPFGLQYLGPVLVRYGTKAGDRLVGSKNLAEMSGREVVLGGRLRFGDRCRRHSGGGRRRHGLERDRHQ